MKVLQITTSDRGGGAEGSALNLFRAYRQRGLETWLVVGVRRNQDANIFEIPNDKHRPRWARLIYSSLKFLPSSKLRKSERLRRLLMPVAEPLRFSGYLRGHEDFDYPGTWRITDLLPGVPEVVHCHNLHGGFFDLGYLPWLGRTFPLVLNLRDTWLLTGHCAHFLDCERWRTGCGKCPYLEIYPAVRSDGTAYNWLRKRQIIQRTRFYATAPSQWVIDKAQQAMLNAREYRVIPNGIDLSTFKRGDKIAARRRVGLPGNRRIVLFAAHRARNNPFKDYGTIEQAIRILGEREDLADLLFVSVGGTNETQSIGRVEARCYEYVTDPKVLADYYRAADLFVHAARAEAFGKTIIEAQACGTAVIATAVGGIPEVVDSGRSGCLVPVSDANAMAASIDQMLRQPALRRAIAEAGHQSAQHYSVQRQADTFLEWYAELVEKHGTSATDRHLG